MAATNLKFAAPSRKRSGVRIKMENGKSVRRPQQKRSIHMKETILAASKTLFCANGYYNTTTNEIAKSAGISIGSLYSYFPDKDAILAELLERSNQYHFSNVFEKLRTETSAQLYQNEPKKWLYNLVNNLIQLHEAEKDFLRELNVLYFAKPEVMAMKDSQSEKVRIATYEYIQQYQNELPYEDLEAISVVIMDFITALVDRIVFKESNMGKERILSAGIDTLYQIIHK